MRFLGHLSSLSNAWPRARGLAPARVLVALAVALAVFATATSWAGTLPMTLEPAAEALLDESSKADGDDLDAFAASCAPGPMSLHRVKRMSAAGRFATRDRHGQRVRARAPPLIG